MSVNPFKERTDSLTQSSCLYQFTKLGDDDDEIEFSSSSYPGKGMAEPFLPLPKALFKPRVLENLTPVDEMVSLDPVLDSKVLNLLPNSDSPQIFTVCGRGARSTFRVLRHGLETQEVVSSDLPGIPNAVWTTKLKEDGKRQPKKVYPESLTFLKIRSIHTSFCLS